MSNITLPTPQPLLSRTGWAAWLAALIVLCALVPVLNLMVPEGSVLHLSDFAVALTAKIMCYSICALAMGLIWGYTGILSLGHGLFFALGGYAMGMYLMRQIGLDGNYKSKLPDFMVFLDWKELPWHWALSGSFGATLFLVVAVPGLVAFVFGFANFFASPILGALSDQYGRRPVLLLGFFGLGLNFFATALATSLAMLLLTP